MSISNKLRFEILRRDNFRCQYCGKTGKEVSLEVDHIDPKQNGGPDDEGNLITACWECNNGKRADPLLTHSEMGKCIPQGPGCDGNIKWHLCQGCYDFTRNDSLWDGQNKGRDEGWRAALLNMFSHLLGMAKDMDYDQFNEDVIDLMQSNVISEPVDENQE